MVVEADVMIRRRYCAVDPFKLQASPITMDEISDGWKDRASELH